MAPPQAPCDWLVQECGPLPATGSPEYTDMHDAAAGVLWALSGRQFGTCEVIRRPCSRTCRSPAGEEWPWPSASLNDGQWVNLTCRTCVGDCSCTEVHEVRLPGPIAGITEVVIDDQVVPTGSYRVDDYTWLVRTDGGTWPTCQDMNAAPFAVGYWGVTYLKGVAVPSDGQRALGELMSELYLACSGDSSCKLPKRVQQITKPGISFAILDPMDFIREGRTGLYFVDLFLKAVNPNGRSRGARVWSPDAPDGRTTTWP